MAGWAKARMKTGKAREAATAAVWETAAAG